jgi:hypothetical protein
MAYVINKFDGTPLVVLEDGTVNTTTSLGLVGRNYTGYGEIQNENFLHLLENFANNAPPSTPLSGQTWYNKTTESLNIYTGTTWVSINSATISNTAPTATSGSLWYNSLSNQLFLYDTDKWVLIGPEAVLGFGDTRLKSDTVLDSADISRPVIKFLIDDTVLAIVSKDNFNIGPTNLIPNFFSIRSGITLASDQSLSGSLFGNASTASKLESGNTINGVLFDGSQAIDVKSSTTNLLKRGDYLVGSNFDGSTEITWSVDATPSNSIGKVVARDSAGNFSAGTVTANLVGNVVGNVTAIAGVSRFNRVEATEFVGATLSGNAFSASRLLTTRKINGIDFNGTQDITVPVAALDLTGTKLSPSVTESSITSLGILSQLKTQDAGIIVGDNSDIRLTVDQSQHPTIFVDSTRGLAISLADAKQAGNRADFQFVPSDIALMMGGPEDPAFVGDANSKCNIGLPTQTFANVYSDNFVGIAASARYADLAENYVADAAYNPGTVLEFGGENEVTLATESTHSVAGIVSTRPAYLMNSECSGEYVVALALQGRVPCKVIGPIKKGDMLISAGNGFAKTCSTPTLGAVIGKSLEDFAVGEGVIEVAAGRI